MCPEGQCCPPCGEGAHCVDGDCVPGCPEPLPLCHLCVDGKLVDMCTPCEFCDPNSGCLPKDCNDANLCTDDVCDSSGECVHTARICPDGGECYATDCEPNNGCVYKPLLPRVDLRIDSDNDNDIDDGDEAGEDNPPGKIICVNGDAELRIILTHCPWNPAFKWTLDYPEDLVSMTDVSEVMTYGSGVWSHGAPPPITVHGLAPGGPFSIVLRVVSPHQGMVSDSVRATVVGFTADVSPNPICVNLKDGDENGIPDAYQGSSAAGDAYNDPALALLTIQGVGAHGATLVLDIPGNLHVWEHRDKSPGSMLVDFGGKPGIQLPNGSFTRYLYCEGLEVGSTSIGMKIVVGQNVSECQTTQVPVEVVGLGPVKLDSTHLPNGCDTTTTARIEGGSGQLPVTWSIKGSRGCGASINPHTGEISLTGGERGSAWVIATTPAGCVSRAQLEIGQIGCSGQVSAGEVEIDRSVSLRIDLGNDGDGQSAGALCFYAGRGNSNLYAPENFQYSTAARPGISAVYNGLAPRQVQTPAALVDLTTDTTNCKTTIRFFTPSNADLGPLDPETGLFAVSRAQPFTTWEVSNPDGPASPDRLVFRRTSGDSVVEYRTTYARTQDGWSWTLAKGDGQSTLRSETKTWSDNGTSALHQRWDDNGLSHSVRETYAQDEGACLVREQVIDPGGLNLRTTREFYQDVSGPRRWLLRSIKNPDGSWTWYDYDPDDPRKVPTRIVASWHDGTLDGDPDPDAARETLLNYTPLPIETADGATALERSRARTTTEKVLGQAISKTYNAFYRAANGARIEITERCAEPSASFGDAANFRTTVTYQFGNDRRVASIAYPDGRLDTYFADETGSLTAMPTNPQFQPGAGSYRRRVVLHGTSAMSGLIGKTTFDTSVLDPAGRVVVSETYVYTGSSTPGASDRISWVARTLDGVGRPVETYYSNGVHTSATWDCCHQSSATDAYGATTEFQSDSLGRVRHMIRHSAPQAGENPAQAEFRTTTDFGTIVENELTLRQITTTMTGGSLTLVETKKYDLADRLVESVDAGGFVTKYTYGTSRSGGLLATVLPPNGAAIDTAYYPDGSVDYQDGAGAVARYYTYGVADGRPWADVHVGSAESPRWAKTSYDNLARVRTVSQPAYGGGMLTTQHEYYPAGSFGGGRLKYRQTTGPNGPVDVPHWNVYDALGNLVQAGLDIDGNGLSPAGSDRLMQVDSEFALVGSDWWHQQTRKLFTVDGSETPTVVSIAKNRLTGFAGVPGIPSAYVAVSETQLTDATGNMTAARAFVSRDQGLGLTRTVYPDGTSAEAQSYYGRVWSSTSKTGANVLYSHDDLGRQTETDGPRAGVWTRTVYDPSGAAAPPDRPWKIDASGIAGPAAVYGYDVYGRLASVTNVAGKSTRYGYDPLGRVTNVWGDVPQPQWVEYDAYGQRWKLHTYRSDAPAWAGTGWSEDAGPGDVTTWEYDESTGLVTAKWDALSKSVAYTYAPDGKLHSRTWARGVTTTYTYRGEDAGDTGDPCAPLTGELRRIAYSDATPAVAFKYNRAGAVREVTDAAGTHTFAYTASLRPATETITGALYGSVVQVGTDYEPAGLQRFDGLHVTLDGTGIYATAYAYDLVGRIGRVSGPGLPAYGAVYTYENTGGVASDLVTRIDFRRDENTTLLATSRAFEPLRDVLDDVQNVWRPGASGQLVSRYDYASDGLGRRSSVVNSGSAFGGTGSERLTLWGYDDRNELTLSDRRTGSDPNTPGPAIAAEHFSYAYDAIGNRATYVEGVPATTTYLTNGANEYFRTRTSAAQRLEQGLRYDEDGNLVEYFVAADMNCDGSVSYADINPFVLAMSNRSRFEARYPNCDWLNGDLNGDGAVNYADIDVFSSLFSGGVAVSWGLRAGLTWDGENRLVGFEPQAPTAASHKVAFTYDYVGRRVGEKVYAWDTSDANNPHWGATPVESRTFVWHGWKLLAELEGGGEGGGGGGTGVSPVRSYTWGLDLAGQMGSAGVPPASLEGAGGIGGLLAVSDTNGTPSDAGDDLAYVYLYDGNGNVVQVIDPNAPDVSAAVVARYEYDPYGDRVNPPADPNSEYRQPFRFSTKPFEAVTGLYYYGYRWYSPGLGRWISRDPLEEAGGANLQGFNQNAPPDVFDPLGLIPPFGSKADVEACAAVAPMIQDSLQPCATAFSGIVQACTSPYASEATTLPFAAGEGTPCSSDLQSDLQRFFELFAADVAEQNAVNASRLFEGCSGADVPLLGPAFTTFTGRRLNLLDLTFREVGREERQSAELSFSIDATALLACARAYAPRVAVGECGQSAAATETVLGTNTPGALTSRATWRKATIERNWAQAADGPSGGKLCPTCSRESIVAPGRGLRDWDIDHSPPWTRRSFPKDVSRKEVCDSYQEGTRLECPKCNRSRGNRTE